MVSMCFIILQSFGKIVQRAPAVGAKIWRFFSLSRSVSGRLFVRVSPYWKLRFPVLILRHLNLKDYSSNFIDNCKICSIEVLVNDNNEIINSAKFCCRYNDLYRRRSFGTQGRILNSMGTWRIELHAVTQTWKMQADILRCWMLMVRIVTSIDHHICHYVPNGDINELRHSLRCFANDNNVVPSLWLLCPLPGGGH